MSRPTRDRAFPPGPWDGYARENASGPDETISAAAAFEPDAILCSVSDAADRLKDRSDGFARYYDERAKRLKALAHGWVRLEAEVPPELVVRVYDSGPGYVFQEGAPRERSAQAHGHGLTILRGLCRSVEISDDGSQAVARLPLSE